MRMRYWVLFICSISVFGVPGASSQTMINSEGLGSPRAEEYSIDKAVELSVEYGVSGGVAAIRIAAPNYSPDAPPVAVPSDRVDQIVDTLAPGLTTSGLQSQREVAGWAPGILRDVRRLTGIVLTRDYPLLEGKRTMFSASLEIGPQASGVSSRAIELTRRLGPAKLARYVFASGLSVEIAGPVRAARRLFISSYSPLLSVPVRNESIDASAVRALINKVVPFADVDRSANLGRFQSGALVIIRMTSGTALFLYSYDATYEIERLVSVEVILQGG